MYCCVLYLICQDFSEVEARIASADTVQTMSSPHCFDFSMQGMIVHGYRVCGMVPPFLDPLGERLIRAPHQS